MKARSAHPDATYHDVTRERGKLEEMLRHSQGLRKVPVIVTDGKAVVGFGGT